MDFIELVRNRRSVRSFRKSKVDPARLVAIMEAVRAAPSAGNLQSYRVAVVEELRLKAALAMAAGGQQFLEAAALILVFFADLERSAARYADRGRALFALQDATIAAAYAQLAIVAAGMASTWIGYFDETAVSRALGLENGLVPVAMLSVGYPAELPEPTSRRRLDEVVKYR